VLSAADYRPCRHHDASPSAALDRNPRHVARAARGVGASTGAGSDASSSRGPAAGRKTRSRARTSLPRLSRRPGRGP